MLLSAKEGHGCNLMGEIPHYLLPHLMVSWTTEVVTLARMQSSAPDTYTVGLSGRKTTGCMPSGHTSMPTTGLTESPAWAEGADVVHHVGMRVTYCLKALNCKTILTSGLAYPHSLTLYRNPCGGTSSHGCSIHQQVPRQGLCSSGWPNP